MKRGSIFKKILAYLIAACLFTAVLSAVLYSFTGGGMYARRIAEEMIPRAHGMGRLAERMQTGQISFDSFVDFTVREQQGYRVYIFDSENKLLAYTADREDAGPSKAMQAYAERVIADGEQLVSTAWRSREGIVVGVPIRDNMRRVTGAILLSKPSKEVYDAIRNMNLALLCGGVGVSVLMILPAYYVSKRMSDPIRRMTAASEAMWAGDFSVRADETLNDEIGQLGRALNHLSARLDENIRDLVLARNRLHVILDDMHEGVVALSAEGTILYRNPAALSLLSAGDEAMLYRALEPAMAPVRQVAADREQRSLPLTVGERKLLLVLSCSQETSEAAPGAVMVIQDVTAAERLEQTRRDYVANVSHELRTPIASIRSLAETLDDGLVKTEEDRSRYYGYILRESMRLSRLINDLLELSRLQSGAVALEKREFSLNDLVLEVRERMALTASYSGIAVTAALPQGAPLMVSSNRDRIEQVLIALVDNAIKFAADDGRILIEAVEQGGVALVSVRNTGRIGEKDLPHLFDRFYKADASHSDGGTGLGLAIVQEVLALLGETVEAANRDGDAVFRFTVHKAPEGGAER